MKSPPTGDRIVSMVEFQGNLYLATEHSVYRLLIDGEWEIVMFKELPPEEPPK